MVAFWRLGAGLTIFFLVFALVLFSPPNHVQTCLKPLCYLGEISYGIYLWHLLVIFSLQRTVIRDNPVQMIIYGLIITLSLSSISWHFLEKPMILKAKKVPLPNVM
jgi:peptidoglycan/LPS O-acetylase OafA/YrhL